MRIDVALEHRDLEAELAALHARMARPGDALHGLPVLAGSPPGLVFRYRETDGEFHVYVEDPARAVLAGCTVFGRAPELDRRVARYVRSPHSRYAAAYRGRGVASAVYEWALHAGLCLLSGPRQSPAAHGLWMKLARNWPLAYVETRDGQLRMLETQVDGSAFEDLDTRLLLLARGWTRERFASATSVVPAQAQWRSEQHGGPWPGPEGICPAHSMSPGTA
ncbi:MAG TPA: N-acetyltransferase [Ramlibacter sp.]|uniref:N-acetyltransferase n=1 Tax=Ramlibacter sp. TaxID=1917967 RepID=UPI002D7EF24C|nr:N-acetyltransferase [Ramlibacter sp.]HET8746733.1 N-acetyltransferase [Ramlibacter sp.]